METIQPTRFRGPHLGVLATIFTILFITGLSFVISFTGGPHFPSPSDSAAAITTYFYQQPHDVLWCAFFQFVSAVPLGLLTVTAYTRLRHLGVKATGPAIALLGGMITAINVGISSLVIWVMAYPGIAQDGVVIRALYYITFAIGGVGYSVPLGLLIAGLAVPAAFMRLLPKWVVWFGLVLAVIGEASAFSLVFPGLVLLIPLTRFPGFIWLIITGWKLAARSA
jgi:hypothetical protein